MGREGGVPVGRRRRSRGLPIRSSSRLKLTGNVRSYLKMQIVLAANMKPARGSRLADFANANGQVKAAGRVQSHGEADGGGLGKGPPMLGRHASLESGHVTRLGWAHPPFVGGTGG